MRALPESCKSEALATLASISDVVPAGDSDQWGNTAQDLITDLLQDVDCMLIPKVLPCGHTAHVVCKQDIIINLLIINANVTNTRT